MNLPAGELIELPGLGVAHKTPQHILLQTTQPMLATGSCIWNGGSATVHGWLNMKVSRSSTLTEHPAQSLQHYAQSLQQHQPLAGMMTAASMNSLRWEIHGDATVTVACLVTAGIENARRTGDPADEQIAPGTINIALLCNQAFTPAACIEALMMVTEAKTAACHELQIRSPVSGRIATGTGTDSVCLLSALSASETVEYCGKHTRIGEWIGRSAYGAIHAALTACIDMLNVANP